MNIPNFPRDHHFKYLRIKQNINKRSFLNDETCLMACQANANNNAKEKEQELTHFACLVA